MLSRRRFIKGLLGVAVAVTVPIPALHRRAEALYQDYSIEIDAQGQSIAEVYEHIKYVTRRFDETRNDQTATLDDCLPSYRLDKTVVDIDGCETGSQRYSIAHEE